MLTTTIITTVIIAAITCLFGFRLNKLLIAVAGFGVGYYLCNAGLTSALGEGFITFAVSILVGLLIAFLAFKLYLAGIFVLCFVLAYAACNVFIEAGTLGTILSIAAGLIVGMLGVWFTRPIIIISTSLSGAFVIADNILPLLNFNMPIANLIVGLVIAFLAAEYQFRTTKDLEPSPKIY